MQEENGYHISIASQETATRDDIVIDYRPTANIANYSYTIIKDGKKGKSVVIEDNSATRIALTDTGHYKIEFTNYTASGEVQAFETGRYVIDKDAPRIEINKDSLKVEIGSTVDILSGVRAVDNEDGVISNEKITTNFDSNSFSTVGKKEVTYKVSDEAGNTTVRTITFEVVDNNREMVFLKECVAIGMICVALLLIIEYYRSMLIEKRISKYSLQPRRKNNSVFDKIVLLKDSMIDSFANALSKMKIINTYAKTYEKYQIAFREKTGVHIIAKKMITSMLFLAVSILASAIRLEILSFIEMIIALLLGYILVDIVYFVRYHFYRNHVENDLLQAVIVMNNAFKSGHSIPQAIELVAEELDAYINSSISVLNETGGNIVKVFSSIEKTLMNKKKLRLELKALTSSAKIVSYVLMLLPLLFILGISFVSPDYFLPLVTSPTGWLLLFVIMLVYLLYICIIKKIMKVRM